MRGDLDDAATRSLGIGGVGLLGETGFGRDRNIQCVRQWFDGLCTSNPLGGVDVGDAERQQLRNQCLRLLKAVGIQWSVPVVAGIPILAARGSVPDDQNALGVGR